MEQYYLMLKKRDSPTPKKLVNPEFCIQLKYPSKIRIQ